MFNPAYSALIIVDALVDFCEGGAMGTKGANAVVEDICTFAEEFHRRGGKVILIQDYHPSNHTSFSENHPNKKPYDVVKMRYGLQTLWTKHAVAGEVGSEFHPSVARRVLPLADAIIRKGTNPEIDSYSAHLENDGCTPTGLTGYLEDRAIGSCIYVGLLRDFCVGSSAVDGAKAGFDSYLIESLTLSLKLSLGFGVTSDDVMTDRLKEARVKLIQSYQFD